MDVVGQVAHLGQAAPHRVERLEPGRTAFGQPQRRVPVAHRRTCPSPRTTHFNVVSSFTPMGPRACSFWVEMPTSAPEPELLTVDEPRRRVHQHRRPVDLGHEAVGGRHVGGDDGLGMPRAVPRDVLDGVAHVVDHADGHHRAEELGGEVALQGRHGVGHDGAHPLVGPDLDARRRQRRGQPGQERSRHTGVHEDRLDRVADPEAVRLGVDRQLVRHGQVGRAVDVDVAVPVAVEHVGHGGVLDQRRDERPTAARDQAVDEAAQPHEGDRRLVRGVLDEGHGVLGQPRLHGGPAEQRHDGPVGVEGGGRPAQEGRVARLEAEAGGVARHVRAVLVDHTHDAERDAHPGHPQAVGAHPALGDLPDRVGQGRHLAQAARHGPHPLLGQAQPVAGRLDHAGRLGPLQVGPVGLDQRRPLLLEEVGRQAQCVVAHRARRPRHHPGGRPDAARELLQCRRGHRVRLQAPGRHGGRRPGCAVPSTRWPARGAPGPGPWRRPARRGRRSRPRPRGGSRRRPR